MRRGLGTGAPASVRASFHTVNAGSVTSLAQVGADGATRAHHVHRLRDRGIPGRSRGTGRPRAARHRHSLRGVATRSIYALNRHRIGLFLCRVSIPSEASTATTAPRVAACLIDSTRAPVPAPTSTTNAAVERPSRSTTARAGGRITSLHDANVALDPEVVCRRDLTAKRPRRGVHAACGRRMRSRTPRTPERLASPAAPPNVSVGGPIRTSTKPTSSSIFCQPARGSPRAIQPVQEVDVGQRLRRHAPLARRTGR